MEIFFQLFINSLIAAGIYGLVALGFNFLYRATKFFNLAYGVYAVIGGYAVLALGRAGVPLWAAAPLGILAAAGVGAACEKFVYARLRARRASALVQLVASIGVMTALQAVIAIIFSSEFQTLSEFAPSSTSYSIGGGVVTSVQLIIFGSTALILFGLALLLKFTLLGKAMKAVSDDEEVSKIVGINTGRVITIISAIGAGIAGWAGILVGFDTGLQPTLGLALLLKGVIAAIIGGIGSLYGGVLGALLLGLAENFGIWKIASEWKDAIAFVLLILFLIFRPQGIVKR